MRAFRRCFWEKFRSSLSFEDFLSLLSVCLFSDLVGEKKKKVVAQRYSSTWTFNPAPPLAEELLREEDA